VTVVTPFASGPLIAVGVKLTVGSLKLRTGAAPNPVPVIVTAVLSPELIVCGADVGITGADSFKLYASHIALTGLPEGSTDPPAQALIVVVTTPLGGGLLMTYVMTFGKFGLVGSTLILPGLPKGFELIFWLQETVLLFGFVGPFTFATKSKPVFIFASNVCPRVGVVVRLTVTVGMWIANGALNATAGSMVLVA